MSTHILFPDRGPDGDGPDDADLSTLAAYLARELTLIEAEAVEDRLATDAAFRSRVQPLIDAWESPASFAMEHRIAPSLPPGLAPTTAEVEAGWSRYRAGARRRRAWRVAAMITIAALPFVGLAQVAWRYAHRGRSGARLPESAHQLARFPLGESAGRRGVDLAIGLERDAAAAGSAQPGERSLGPVLARTPRAYRAIAQVVRLSDGRVLVNDTVQRIVFVVDSTLSRSREFLEIGRYGSRVAELLAFRGDSTLIDPRGDDVEISVLDPVGRIPRIMVPQRAGVALWSSTFGFVRSVGLPLVVPANLSVHATAIRVRGSGSLLGTGSGGVGRDTIVRLATVAQLAMLGAMNGGRFAEIAPLPSRDLWTVLADGSIAVLRADEYRVEIFASGGRHTLGPPIPYAWVRMAEDQKTRAADSLNAPRDSAYATKLAGWLADSAEAARKFGHAVPTIRRDTLPRPGLIPPVPYILAYVRQDDVVVRELYRGVSSLVPGGVPDTRAPIRLLPGLLPDALPAVNPDSPFLADADNRLWIRPQHWVSITAPPTSPPVYDIVDREGRLVDRVRIPDNRTIVGFGPGVVYLATREPGAVGLEVVRFK